MPNSSSESRCSSAPLQRPAQLTAASQLRRAGARACRARPRRPRAGALATKPLVGELALGAGDLGLEPRAPLARCARASASRSTASDGEHRDRCRRAPATVATGSPPFGAPLDAREPRDVRRPCARSPRPPAAPRASRPGGAPTRSRQPRSSCTAAIARASSRLGRLVDQRVVGLRATAAPSAGPRRRGRATRSPRSRTGSPGARARASPPARAARPRETSALSSAYSRGLISSRYQSQRSP